MITLLLIAGGVALLLFGVRYLRKGLDRLFGQRLGLAMQRVGQKRRWAFLTGLGVSVIAPSSTTVSLLAVQTVQTGQMTAAQMLAVMLGANIGLTVMVQLISLDVTVYAPLLILAGVILHQFTWQRRSRGVGQVLLSFGFIFLAIGIIKSALAESGLCNHEDFRQLLEITKKYPVFITLVAAVMAMTLQSTTATIGLVIGLTAAPVEAGLIDLRVAFPVVIGANLGLAGTMLLLGWRQVDSRRLALCNGLLKLAIALPLVALMVWFGGHLPATEPQQTAHWVAHANTGFNVLVAALGLPLLDPVVAFIQRVAPETPADRNHQFGPKFIHDGPIGGIALALGQSLREIMHVSELVRSMLEDVWTALLTDDEQLARDVSERDDQVDLLDSKIKRYLSRIVKEEADDRDADEQILQLRYLNELETIGDTIDKNLSELVRKKVRLAAKFSDDGMQEIQDFYQKVLENLAIADTVFTTRDRMLAQQLLRHKERVNQYELELRDRHFARLRAGLAEAHETSAIHLDLLTHLKRINSCAAHVAIPIIEDGKRQATAASGSTPD